MAAQEETENALDAAAAQQIADAVHAQEPFPVAAETDDGDRPMDEGVGATHSSATEVCACHLFEYCLLHLLEMGHSHLAAQP